MCSTKATWLNFTPERVARHAPAWLAVRVPLSSDVGEQSRSRILAIRPVGFEFVSSGLHTRPRRRGWAGDFRCHEATIMEQGRIFVTNFPAQRETQLDAPHTAGFYGVEYPGGNRPQT